MHDDMTRDHGLQPLDAMVSRWGLTNHGLVEQSVEQLNHKQVQRARHGRQLTLSMMQKVARALNDAILTRLSKDERSKFSPYAHKHLFNYAKGHDADRTDPNTSLMPAPPEAG